MGLRPGWSRKRGMGPPWPGGLGTARGRGLPFQEFFPGHAEGAFDLPDMSPGQFRAGFGEAVADADGLSFAAGIPTGRGYQDTVASDIPDIKASPKEETLDLLPFRPAQAHAKAGSVTFVLNALAGLVTLTERSRGHFP